MRARFSHTRAGIVHVFVRCKELVLLERWREILGKEREARELDNLSTSRADRSIEPTFIYPHASI